jgi:hypothetical protein
VVWHIVLDSGPSWTDKTIAIGTAIAAGGFVVTAIGAWFAYDQVKETRRDRHIQVLSEFGRRWDEQLLWEARERQFLYTDEQLAARVDKWFKTQDRDVSDVPILLRVPNYFEDLAIMVEAGRLEVKYVAQAMGSLALRMWEYWAPAVEKMREQAPTSYTQFEKLVGELEATTLE